MLRNLWRFDNGWGTAMRYGQNRNAFAYANCKAFVKNAAECSRRNASATLDNLTREFNAV
ncbi:hypothetical protein JCM31598_35430 [Desulfonatronum parangueonense]